MYDDEDRLRCDMRKSCAEPVTMIDEKGYVYCTGHGEDRRWSGVRCRKIRLHEVRRLQRGEPVERY